MTDHLKITREDGVQELIFARPERKNSITRAMYEAIGEAIAAADADPNVKVTLISAEGDVFTAGNDIGEFALQATGQTGEYSDLPHGAIVMLNAMAGAEKPIVAAVQGRAVGVGLTMLLHCDLVFIAEGASISAPFANLGLTPENAASLLLPQRIGYMRAFATFVLGEAIDAAEAVRLGLAYKALPAGEVRREALEAAKLMAAKSPSAVTATKKLMRDGAALKALIQREAKIFGAQVRTPEARAAFEAFLNKAKA